MSSPPTIEPFKGTNWEECDDFIRAVRAVAWKEGKIQDPRWIADFASLHFSRKALSWHSRLPQDVREDWTKLLVALLDQWPPPEDENDIRPRIEPTPAAAPSLNRSYRVNHPLEGVLKVVFDGSDEDRYLKITDGDGRGELTQNAIQALRIRCSSSSNTTVIERIDGSGHSWLAVQRRDTDFGFSDYGFLVLVDALTLETSWGTGLPHQVLEFIVSADGEVIPFRKNDGIRIPISIFSGGGLLYLAEDPSTYSAYYPDEKALKLFLEPTD